MARPTGPGGVSDFFFQWSAQRAREEFRIFFFNGPPNGPGRFFFSMVREEFRISFFQWSAQRAREGFRFSMVRPTGLRGRGRVFFQWFAQRVCGVGVGFFQWFAQRAREGLVRPTGPGGVSFFNGPPNGPGRGFVFQWFAQRVWRGFGFFFEYWSAQRAWGVSFFNGPPNPFGLPRTPNPKGTFARLWATQCYSSRVYMYVRPVRIARFARFCATKCCYYRPYMYVHPGVIAFLHGFARFAHASPRSFDWFAQPVGFPNPLPKKA